MKVLACFTLAQLLLAVFSPRVHTAPVAAQVFASETADLRCNEIMKALSANNYAAARAHFDPAMKASFSPERIGSIWRHATEADGRLISLGG